MPPLLDDLRGRLSKQSATRKSLSIACATVFLIALIVRLFYFHDMRGEVLYEKSLATTLVYKYEEEKARMFNDGGILFPAKAVDPCDARMLFHPPGYSILLAAIYGHDTPDDYYSTLRLLQIFCDALGSILILLIAARLLPFGVAVIAGLLASLSPHLAYQSLWLSPDSLCVPPLLGSIYLLTVAHQNPRIKTVVMGGALLGLSCWLRSNALLLPLVLAPVIALVFPGGKRLRYSALFVCATIVVISPITIRNWVVFHRFVPVTLANGLLIVEGISEYDREGKFGMVPYDQEVCTKEVEWYGRRDYRHNLWVPDGIERDRGRFARGVEILRRNPAWAAKMMFSRMAFVLRFNDFGPTQLPSRTSRAPSIFWGPGFGAETGVTAGSAPVFSGAPQYLMNDFTTSSDRSIALVEDGRELRISGRALPDEDIVASAPFPLKKYTDYILRISAELDRGDGALEVKSADLRLGLGRKALEGKVREEADIAEEQPTASTQDEQTNSIVEIPFASGHQDEGRVVFRGNGKEKAEVSARLGEIELFELTPTPYQWTRPFRTVIRALQQNIFKTSIMRLLIFIGIIVLVLSVGFQSTLIILAVPVYYLSSHAPFGIDYRFTLPMHYFFFTCAAMTLYSAGLVGTLVAGRVKNLNRR